MSAQPILRPERPGDEAAIAELTELAFRGRDYAGGDEQDVIDRLRARGGLVLSLVAELEGEIVGQVTFSRATVADGSSPWFALGPVSVTPDKQGIGIGGQLINSGLAEMQALGGHGCILTGNPVYYRRVGFELAPANSAVDEPAEFFQLKLFGGKAPEGAFAFDRSFYE